MNIDRFKLYDAAVKDLLKLKAQLFPWEFSLYGYTAQLESYRVEMHLAIHHGGLK